MTQPVSLTPGTLDLCALSGELPFKRATLVPELFDLCGLLFEPAESIEQAPVRRDLNQCALVVLTMNLDQGCSKRPQRLCAHGLVVHERASASVGKLNSAQNQFVLGCNGVIREKVAH